MNDLFSRVIVAALSGAIMAVIYFIFKYFKKIILKINIWIDSRSIYNKNKNVKQSRG